LHQVVENKGDIVSKKVATSVLIRYNGSMEFERSKFFNAGNNILSYELNGQPNFVARFKYRSSPVTKAKFMAVLVKYYTVEDFFKKLQSSAPLQVLMNDGLLVHTGGKIILDGKVING